MRKALVRLGAVEVVEERKQREHKVLARVAIFQDRKKLQEKHACFLCGFCHRELSFQYMNTVNSIRIQGERSRAETE